MEIFHQSVRFMWQFDELVMADGKMVLCIHSHLLPPDGVLRFVPANEAGEEKEQSAGGRVEQMLAQRGKPYTSNGPACRTRSVNRERCTR